MLRPTLLSLLLVSSAACDRPWFSWSVGTRPVARLADGSTDPVWTDMVEVARAKWSVPLVDLGCADPFVGDGAEQPVLLVPPDVWTRPDANGLCDPTYIEVKGTVALLEVNLAYETVIPHELGHALGLEHTTDPTSIMHPPASVTEPSTDDIEAAARSIGCLPPSDTKRD